MVRKPKICKYCLGKFNPYSSFQRACSIKCAVELGRQKEIDDRVKGFKEQLKTKKDYVKILQILFNKWIRLRDNDKGCVSCGVFSAEEYHAGHWISATYQSLRFNENNVHKQCSRCNTHLRGNPIPYRIELIKRIGLAQVEELENSRHERFDLTIQDLKDLIRKYKLKLIINETNREGSA